MLHNVIPQVFIAFTGVTAIFLTQSSDANQRRYACLFGMAGQPFWVWSAINASQWGVLALTFLYGFSWGKGIWCNWIRRAT